MSEARRFQISITMLLTVVAMVALGFGWYLWTFPPPDRPFVQLRKVDHYPHRDLKSSKNLFVAVCFFRDNGMQKEIYFDHQPWGTVNETSGPDSDKRYVYHEYLLGTEMGAFNPPQLVPELYQARYDQLIEFATQHLDKPPSEQPFGWQTRIDLPSDFPAFAEFRDAYVEKHGPEVLEPGN